MRYYSPTPQNQLHRFGCSLCGAIAGAHENKDAAERLAKITAIDENWLWIKGELFCPDCIREEYTMQAQAEGVTTA